MKKIFFTIIIILFTAYLINALTIRGNNLIWSPQSIGQFLYSVYGKSSGTTIWKLYHTDTGDEETIYYGNSLVPLWAHETQFIIFSKKNAIVLHYTNNNLELKSSLENITTFDLNNKADKIVYSDGDKIYMCELTKNKHSFVADGSFPYFLDNDKKIIFFDDQLKTKIIDEDLKIRVIFTNVIKKIKPIKTQNQILFSDDTKIELYDLNDNLSYTIVEDTNEIANFEVSQDYQFLTYNNSQGNQYIVHIPSRLKVEILNDKDVFSQKLSPDNKFCAFEKNNSITINNIEKYINSFDLGSIYKISLGLKDELSMGVDVEIYEEKKNPFNQQVIGYDENDFKGVLKIISVFNNYSYGILQKDLSTEKQIETGDYVLWKEKNLTGNIE